VGEKWVADDCSYLCKGLYNVDMRKKPILSNIKNIATTQFFNIQSMDVAFSNESLIDSLVPMSWFLQKKVFSHRNQFLQSILYWLLPRVIHLHQYQDLTEARTIAALYMAKEIIKNQ
jgi:hypothetical protein